MISKNTAISAVSEALETSAIKAPNIKEFRWRIVDATGCDYRTARRWISGETEPEFHDIVNLCEKLGTPFKNDIEHALGSYTCARREHAEAINFANNEATAQTALTAIIGVAEDAKSKLRKAS